MTAEELHVIMQNSMAQAGCYFCCEYKDLNDRAYVGMWIAADRVNAVIQRAVDKAIVELYEKQRQANL